jgi:Filamin/ABP280 repeat.
LYVYLVDCDIISFISDESLPKVKDIDVKEGKKPNSYIVTYIPPKEGEYVITVTFATLPVPKSPFKIKVEPGCDASKCKVKGQGMF